MSDKTEENKKINIWKKAVGAIVLMLVLFIPVCAALFFLVRHFSWQRETQLEQINLNVLKRIAGYANQQYLNAEKTFDDHIRKEVSLTVSFLKEYVTEDGYTGPEILSDGFVIRFDGDRAIIPAGISADAVSAEKNLIEESIRTGTVRAAALDTDMIGTGVSSLSFGQISGDAVYAHITSDEEYGQFLDRYRQESLSSLETATDISGGMTLIVSEQNGSLVELERFGNVFPEDGTQNLGLTEQDLTGEGSGHRKVQGHRYRYTCARADGAWLGFEDVYIIQIFRMDSMISQLLMLSVMICLMMMIFYITIITYSLSEKEYVIKKALSTDEAARYNPKRLRRRMRSIGIVSVIVVLLIAFLTQSVIQMRQQASNGKHVLQLLSGLRSGDSGGLDEAVREIRENWYLQYGMRISSFLKGSPDMQTEEKLRECAEITGADFIMLFDPDGKELLCSNDYDGFTLEKGLGENSSDFNRLLLGIEGIIHGVSVDKTTGLERQMIGVTVDLAGKGEEHGALILALMPDAAGIADIPETDEEVSLLIPEGRLCLAVKKSNGEILYSSEPDLTGRTAEDIGLAENSLQDGFMDFGTIRGISRFIVTHEEGNSVYYYAVDNSVLRTENLWYGIMAAVLYAAVLIILLKYLLSDYDEEFYRKWSVIIPALGREYSDAEWEALKSDRAARRQIRTHRKDLKSPGQDRAAKRRLIRWESMPPEKRARTVFMIGLFVLLQMWVLLMSGSYLRSVNEKPLLDYLLNGDWMRGFNLFALYSILVCIAAGNLVIMGSGWILHQIAGILGAKGETVCGLLQSLIKFITAVVVILMSLSYVGLLNSQVLASMGIGSVALSLGAQDFISDILTGIIIVFNETVRVGDIVEYQGLMARVREIKIQSTQLISIPDNDILTVRNKEIANIINKSRTASVCELEMKVHADVSLEKIDSMMKEALPGIGKGCSKIIGIPQYLGIVELRNTTVYGTGPLMKIEVDTYCDEKDRTDVLIYMNTELHRLFEKEGIEVI